MTTSTGDTPPARPHRRGARSPVTVVLGTRPEAIKLAPLLDLLGDHAETIHTGQHTDPHLTDLHPRTPRPALGTPAIMGLHRGHQIAATIADLTSRWTRHRPRAVIVHGDTNTALAAALAANAVGALLVHVEAGLRNHDRAMPEEHNRILIDHLADLCCAPTPGNVANLLAENIPAHRIALTGNTIIEAVTTCPRDPDGAAATLAPLHGSGYVLATIHRPENTDHPRRLDAILTALDQLDQPVLLPLHPRTRERLTGTHHAAAATNPHLIAPVAYPVFLELARTATLIVSDSGGVQEEAAVLARPLIVLRHSTERPEALGPTCRLVHDPTHLPRLARDLHTTPRWASPRTTPFGDGHASARIARMILQALDTDQRPVPDPLEAICALTG